MVDPSQLSDEQLQAEIERLVSERSWIGVFYPDYEKANLLGAVQGEESWDEYLQQARVATEQRWDSGPHGTRLGALRREQSSRASGSPQFEDGAPAATSDAPALDPAVAQVVDEHSDDGHDLGWKARATSGAPRDAALTPIVDQEADPDAPQIFLRSDGYDDGHNFGWRSRTAPATTNGRLLVGGGLLLGAILLVALAYLVLRTSTSTLSTAGAGSTLAPGGATAADATAPATRATAAPVAPAISAMISALGSDGTNPNQYLVTCGMRGSINGMTFHGTLSGPNIGSHDFTAVAGQASPVAPDRVPPPTDAVFRLAFTGGNRPTGPFTCTITSVTKPDGSPLTPATSDWTRTVN